MIDYRIDPMATPKIIDLCKPSSGDEAARLSVLGIYQVEGGRLTIRLAQYLSSVQGDQRPKGFALGPGSADVLLTLERYEPSEDEKALQNDWAVVGQVMDGKAVAENDFRDTRIRFSESVYVIVTASNPYAGIHGKNHVQR